MQVDPPELEFISQAIHSPSEKLSELFAKHPKSEQDKTQHKTHSELQKPKNMNKQFNHVFQIETYDNQQIDHTHHSSCLKAAKSINKTVSSFSHKLRKETLLL